MAGVVLYPAGSISFFEKDTIVQPDNLVALLHSKLATQKLIKDLIILGTMPQDFKQRLLEAAIASETMTPKARRAFIRIIMLKHDS